LKWGQGSKKIRQWQNKVKNKKKRKRRKKEREDNGSYLISDTKSKKMDRKRIITVKESKKNNQLEKVLKESTKKSKNQDCEKQVWTKEVQNTHQTQLGGKIKKDGPSQGKEKKRGWPLGLRRKKEGKKRGGFKSLQEKANSQSQLDSKGKGPKCEKESEEGKFKSMKKSTM